METSKPAGPRILILTVHHGASHQRVSNALRKALLEIQPGLTVEVANALDHCAPWFRAYYNSYEIPLKYWPSLWGWIENIQHNHSSTGPGWLYRKGAQPLFRFIQSFGPDIVIATEVGMCELAAMHKRETRACYRLVGATAGIDLDRAWAQSEVDLYPILPGDIALQLKAEGVPSAKILPCGVPIDPAFGLQLDQTNLRASLGVDPGIPLLLVLFGGTGFGRPKQIMAGLEKVEQPLQAVFIAGRNRRLQENLEKQCQGHPGFRVLGWVDNMHEWMAAANLLVSKPGGLTVVEAMNSGLPLLAFDPLPGAERRACDSIEKWEVGYWVRHQKDLAPTVERLLDFPEDLALLRERALAFARPRAAYDAAEAILKLTQTAD